MSNLLSMLQNIQVYGKGESLMEKVEESKELLPIGDWKVGGKIVARTEIVESQYGNKQVKINLATGGFQFVPIKMEKKGNEYVYPDAKNYRVTQFKVKPYGDNTRQWLVDNDIDPENFAPGKVMVQAVAVK